MARKQQAHRIVRHPQVAQDSSSILAGDSLQDLIDLLKSEGYLVIGPRIVGGAIGVDEIDGIGDMPVGWSDEQQGGRYRLTPSGSEEVFAFASGAQGWKRVFYPPSERLWSAQRVDDALAIEASAPADTRYALLGVRACDVAALAVLDRVLDERGADDRAYEERRGRAFVVAVDCARPGGTCFCASMGTGPAVREPYDLALTEILDEGGHRFVVRVGSERGQQALERLNVRAADGSDLAAAERRMAEAAERMGREMVPDAAALLRRNLEHRRWRETAERCLTCGNCTSVCPTCFCATTEERVSLAGDAAEHWRLWDSCFTIEFSYLHGGSIRSDPAARYRQWITHKLAFWYEQFGVSGCVGCGRCITWCPVGIDITEEARAIRDDEQGS